MWLWSEWPDRGNRPDRGIDIVAHNADGSGLTAVQCKFYDPLHQVTKKDIDTFLSESGKKGFTSRLVVATTDKWNSAAEAALEDQAVPVNRIGLLDLLNSPIDWDSYSLDEPEEMRRTERKTLRPHQREAVKAVTDGLETADRGKLIMACGTGKTFTSLRIAEQMTADAADGGRVLFLVPSIALLSQTLREWSAESDLPIRSFAVCSDVKVNKGRSSANEDVSMVDLAIPATTDAAKLAQRLREPAAPVVIDGVVQRKRPMTVVFSTYQSIDVVAQAQAAGAPDFDLIICDEAHRTTGATAAGADESAFVRVHDNDYIHGAKRVYMTATPRIYDDSTKAKAGEKQAVIASMDDEDLYGGELYRLGFGRAVSLGLLSDYKVLVLTVGEETINRSMQDSLAQNGELALDDAAKIIGCWNALAKHTDNPDEYGSDTAPMRTAVAFAQDIKTSKRFAGAFSSVVDDYLEALRLADAKPDSVRPVKVDHVDGSMNIMERNSRLDWLKQAPLDEVGSCRVLSNARCLSEGVDVPALDAVMFLSPRKSQVDIVQSVGRVMRRAEGKKYGYIILPVVIPIGMSPEDVLKDNDRFRVVWEVLQALRAHDERFDAMVNKIDLNDKKPDQVKIFNVTVPTDTDRDGSTVKDQTGDEAVQGMLDLGSLGDWQDAIYTRLVQKVGSRRYWESWAKDVADIATAHKARLAKRLEDPTVRVEFDRFLEALRANLNESITEDGAIEMLSQHMVSKPVFDALFDDYDFGADNPVAQVMGRMLTVLDDAKLDAETEKLDGFYASVRERCSGIDNAAGKQRVISDLYNNFFKLAFKSTADALGIVYTPIQVVDFILRSVDHLSREHFGKGLTDEGVHVLDPFTGTGTFIVRLLQSGLINPDDLARKYATELHANEILLLAYYIATANIEVAYRDLAIQAELAPTPEVDENGAVETVPYEPFNGIVLTDTFQMTEDGDTLDPVVFADNNERAAAQLALPIQVIIGNPPYAAKQESANDNNASMKYPTLDAKIERTYAARSSATNKNSLYDSYIRAIRWASDRIGDKGIIGFVTNGGFIDANTSDGLRKTFIDEFDEVYVYNLRGNARTAGELRRKERENVFGEGSKTTVAITFLVKDHARTGESVLHYRDIGDYLSRREKLDILDGGALDTMEWQIITPSGDGDWINQRDAAFADWQPIGDKGGVFASYTAGVQTNRDAWVYNFDQTVLDETVTRLIATYNAERARIHAQHAAELHEGVAAKDLATTDAKRIKWTSGLYAALEKNRVVTRQQRVYTGLYRPFDREHLDATDGIIHRPAVLRRYFPTPEHRNLGFYLLGVGAGKPFSSFAVPEVPDLNFYGSEGGQYFPRYTWVTADDGGFDLAAGPNDMVVNGYRRIDNITDATLTDFRRTYDNTVLKDDVFFYVYGLLHSTDYRTRYAADLKKSLPHIPKVTTREDFDVFVAAGRELADLHMNYEDVEPYPLTITGTEPAADPYEWFRVEKMTYGKKKDKTTIHYNSRITITGIPETAQEYMLGARSGLDWVLERYQVKTDKASGIVNDPNAWAKEVGNPRYILDLIGKVAAVSVRTQEIVSALPALNVQEDAHE